MSTKSNLNLQLDEQQKAIRGIYVSSYIPRKCGIATFTKDLTTSINNQNPYALAEIVAISDKGEDYEYPWEVKYRLKQDNAQDYMNVAQYINQSSADIVNLQHEFGLYGGVDGDYILPMLDSIIKPIVVCFHSILPTPDEHKKYIMKRIIDKASAVIAMSNLSRKTLTEIYGCPEEKAVVIHHGVPDFAFEDPKKARKRLGIKTDHMIMVSGLIGPGKGFEYVFQALAQIKKGVKDFKLYVVGSTHPAIVKNEDENYRSQLTKIAKKQKCEDKVVFVDKFMDLSELIQYYLAADINITPHLEPQQPTSGTLAKALGSGKVCISTPFVYAKEMLANDTGILVPFKNSDAIAKAVIKVCNNKELYNMYRSNAYALGKKMMWPRIAQRYLSLFRLIVDTKHAS